MAACAEAITGNKSRGTRVKKHRGEPRWQIPDLGKLKVPENLRALHTEVAARWGIIDLLDFLKESDHLTAFTDAFTTVATRENTPREVIRKRLLLVLYALGTNVGVKRVADGGRHGETEAALRATRHLFVNRDNLRSAIATLVNATLRMRDPLWWGNGTACASDSKKFGSWSSNLMTEYHVRYGTGVRAGSLQSRRASNNITWAGPAPARQSADSRHGHQPTRLHHDHLRRVPSPGHRTIRHETRPDPR